MSDFDFQAAVRSWAGDRRNDLWRLLLAVCGVTITVVATISPETRMSLSDEFAAEGGCACSSIRYRITSRPMFVHCCHCRWCQRETGAAFALNAMIETDRIDVIKGDPDAVMTPSESGRGQTILRCPDCHVALWSHYAGAKDKVAFVRVGTFDNPDLLPPDIHIFTELKQPWLTLPNSVPAYTEYYDWRKEWPEGAQARREALSK